MVRLHYHPNSTFSRRVRIALLEKGLEAELVELDFRGGEHKAPAYLTLNPYTTIMTTMDRLFRKRLLDREKDGQAWRYTPRLSRSQFERALADRLAAEILDTHGETGLAAFVDAAARLDAKLLDHLTRLIEARLRSRL